jgi:hypothetical protein
MVKVGSESEQDTQVQYVGNQGNLVFFGSPAAAGIAFDTKNERNHALTLKNYSDFNRVLESD